MMKTREVTKASSLRRIRPQTDLPAGKLLRGLRAEQVQRLRRILSTPVECIYDPMLSKPSAAATLGTAPTVEIGGRRTLSAADERDLFLRFNFHRYRIMKIIAAARGERLDVEGMRAILHHDEMARKLCAMLVEANLGLVPTMIERSRITGVDFGELISEGQLALLRSVEKFDCARGFKFSTYACRSIITAVTRAVAQMARHRATFAVEFDPAAHAMKMVEERRLLSEDDYLGVLRNVLKSNAASLTRVERNILLERFGSPKAGGEDAEPKTLRRVAEVFGVTKERVRQIQNRALEKLRLAIDDASR
jgi:RNA polymerase primary sigma factor